MKEKGIGSVSLLLGLVPTIVTAKYNGTSLTTMLTDKLGNGSLLYIIIAQVVLCLIGLFLGLKNNKYWGAKLGSFLCSINIIYAIVEIVRMFI